ncbi:hypothetical protein KGQ20_32670 [Catenulispora sp. NF23]|uniref:Uncharacterized protein n=1 Tax=Catenulispora pinistramenti TaxID=2705254 RepID=A0ABS5KND9_9ACTN|nr:hypothetical protein [Catenulispora pinistramenti]MBS2537517.1 hypothetical protein [Catenulispora pinistramenti]MBS2547579.1 hypothetical protein [Catenulispora pinistramenti]
MSTEGYHDDGHDTPGGTGGLGGLGGGRVHGLLATAFDDDMPVLNLVPDAVDGYRRHRRRARVLGGIGGALALAGVAAAGTVLGAGGGHQTQHVDAGSGTSAVPSKIVAKCTGTYNLLDHVPGQFSANQHGLTAVCEQDLTTLRKLTGDSGLGPLTESYPASVAASEPTAEMTPQIGGPDAQIRPGTYLGQRAGSAYHVMIEVEGKTVSLGEDCTSTSCPPNLKLADGRPATKLSGALRDSYVVVHYDATHSVVIRAGLEDRNSDGPLPFDFDKLIASPAFAKLVAFDVRTLDQPAHPA